MRKAEILILYISIRHFVLITSKQNIPFFDALLVSFIQTVATN